MQINQTILQQDVASLKQKNDDIQGISDDGTLTWKITNFAEKMGKRLFTFSIVFKRNLSLSQKVFESVLGKTISIHVIFHDLPF